MAADHRGGTVREMIRKLIIHAGSLALALAVLVFNAQAHGGKIDGPEDLWRAWSFDPLIVISLTISAAIYLSGLLRLWAFSEKGRGISKWSAAAFAGGWFALVIALVSPLHPWGQLLFSAHMTQHEILMLVAAPLMVLGRPFIAAMWAMPQAWRKRVGSFAGSGPVKRTWDIFTNGFVAWAVHAAALWVWHIPFLFQATLESDLVHTLQHASFFGSALLFWFAIIYGERGLASYGAGVLYLFTTSIHSGILGALLTFTTRIWYPIYSDSTASWGLTPLEDQQLGGLIMWVPAGLVYIVAALFMFAGWMRESEKRVLRREELLSGDLA
jgi:putative membrane protein